MDDDVADVEILVGSLGSEAQKVVGELLPALRIERGRAREAGEKRRDMIGRAPQEAIARISPEFDRAAPRRQVLAGARHQPGLVDGSTIAG
jgi:hypothetical protein